MTPFPIPLHHEKHPQDENQLPGSLKARVVAGEKYWEVATHEMTPPEIDTTRTSEQADLCDCQTERVLTTNEDVLWHGCKNGGGRRVECGCTFAPRGQL